jgi:hypothetical protein
MNPGESIQQINEVGEDPSLQQMLSKSLSRDVIVRAIHRSPSPYATSVPADVLAVDLDNGELMSLFAKHTSMRPSSHPEKQVWQREMLVYENLLIGADLPVVRYVGSYPNLNTASLELYLEYVDDWSLIYQSPDCWYLAARRLAHLHDHFATHRNRPEATTC